MSTKPLPIVLATPVPKVDAERKLKNAAHKTAWNGVRTRVATTVATELAASWKPLMKSKDSAIAMMRMARRSGDMIRRNQEFLLAAAGLLSVFVSALVSFLVSVFVSDLVSESADLWFEPRSEEDDLPRA